jgi:hypothetical protein
MRPIVSVFAGLNYGKVVALFKSDSTERTKQVASVADLLECLIQIKGLADTPRRLALRAAAFAAASPGPGEAAGRAREIAGRLLAAETEFRCALSLMLTRERPVLDRLPEARMTGAPRDASGDGQRTFAAERAETVRVLEACSAEQLNRIGLDPSRGPMTVADLVAVMLAHDTDLLGDLVVRRTGDRDSGS